MSAAQSFSAAIEDLAADLDAVADYFTSSKIVQHHGAMDLAAAWDFSSLATLAREIGHQVVGDPELSAEHRARRTDITFD